jgi:hypothetical protein
MRVAVGIICNAPRQGAGIMPGGMFYSRQGMPGEDFEKTILRCKAQNVKIVL